MRKKIFTFLLALAASVGMSWATTVTWNSSTISSIGFLHDGQSFAKDGVTLTVLAGLIDPTDGKWRGVGEDASFKFSTSLGNFTNIEITGTIMSLEGSGWTETSSGAVWTGEANETSLGEYFRDITQIVFTISAAAPAPTYTVALEAGTANANKVTLSKTSAVEGATITVTPDEEYEITAFSATYNTTEEAPSTLNTETGAYSFTMPAYDVTIEATIAAKPVPEGDIFAVFTATAGADGFGGEDYSKLVDGKFISSDWTKWCANDGHKSVPTGESESCWWIDFEASEALNPTGYILTTGNDTGNEHGRNPKNWVLKAKLNAGDAWTTIATVTNDVTMKNKSFKDYKFFVDQSGTYQYFRFEVFANQGAGVMQLCELRLIGAEPVVVTTHTLQLHVNDALMGSVALQNPSNDIIDNGNGTYTVPEGAEVTLQATPNEGYEFIGWKASSSICDFNECEFVDLHKDENPLTVDMYMTAAFMAEFAAVAPQPQPAAVDGKLPGAFSVSPTQKVNFSQGNLRATTADNGTTWTWAFAADQLTFVGNATANTAINGNGTVSDNGTVDLFGWSTTATKYGINNSLDNSTYSGDFVDWGSNPDLIASLGKGWRTLTSAEWTYLLNTRTTTSGVRYAKATVGGKNGLIILPDDWSESYHALASANTGDAAYTYNTFDAAIWSSDFEAHGAVFLPAAAYRRGKDVEHLGDFANYWSASPDGASYAWYLAFSESFLLPAYNYNRVTGEAVRLVSDILQYTITPNEDPKNAGVYYSTFFDSENKYTLPENVEAYVAEVSSNALNLTKIAGEGQTIPADNAVILKSTVTPFTLSISDADAVTFTATNNLHGVDADTDIASVVSGTCYVLSGNSTDGVGFFVYKAPNQLQAHKAYIDLNGSGMAQAPRRMPFVFNGEQTATGVENVQGNVQSTKVIENGVLYIIKNGAKYNAQGQVVK